MKRCPECRRDYYDDTLSFCLEDGSELVHGVSADKIATDDPATAILHTTDAVAESPTSAQIHTTGQTAFISSETAQPSISHIASGKNSIIAAALGIFLVTSLGVGGYWLYGRG